MRQIQSYPGLLINMETKDPVICDPIWLSKMLEVGFISKLIITSGIQINLFANIIQDVAAQIGGLNYMRIAIWSTLPTWSLSMIGVVSLNTTDIQVILIYHLMIQMLWLNNALIL